MVPVFLNIGNEYLRGATATHSFCGSFVDASPLTSTPDLDSFDVACRGLDESWGGEIADLCRTDWCAPLSTGDDALDRSLKASRTLRAARRHRILSDFQATTARRPPLLTQSSRSIGCEQPLNSHGRNLRHQETHATLRSRTTSANLVA